MHKLNISKTVQKSKENLNLKALKVRTAVENIR